MAHYSGYSSVCGHFSKSRKDGFVKSHGFRFSIIVKGSVRCRMNEGDQFIAQWFHLTSGLVDQLVNDGNQCNDWSRVVFHSHREADLWITSSRIRNCTFVVEDGGYVAFLERWGLRLTRGAGKGQQKQPLWPGVFNTTFSGTCVICAGCRISNNELLHNVVVYPDAIVEGCGRIMSDNSNDGSMLRRGNYTKVDVGPENGGRSIQIHANMGFVKACESAFNQAAVAGGGKINFGDDDDNFELMGGDESNMVFVRSHARLSNCPHIQSSYIGPYALVESSVLTSSTLNSTSARPVKVQFQCNVTSSILEPGSTVKDGALVEKSYLAETSCVGIGAQVSHVILGPDSSIARGECHHSLVGPFVGFHHQSLLIAALWPHGRGNVAYGSMIGSNHTSRVNDQECWVGEGCFFGLGSAVKFPCNFASSPYTVFAAKITVPSMKLEYPFSLVLPDASNAQMVVVKPGWVLHSNPYLLERAIDKFSSRRKAEDHNTSQPIFRKIIVDMVRAARLRLQTMLRDNNLALNRFARFACAQDISAGIHAYSDFIQRYALHGAEAIASYVLRYGISHSHTNSHNHNPATSDYDFSGYIPAQEVDSRQVQLLIDDIRSLHDLDGMGGNASTTTNTNTNTNNTTNNNNGSNQGEGKGKSLFMLLASGGGEGGGVQARLKLLRDESGEQFLTEGLLTDLRLDTLLHQWNVLKEEFPGELFAFDRSTSTYEDMDANALGEGAWENAVEAAWEVLYTTLRAKLCTLEQEYSAGVRKSKEKDGEKGGDIIPDYHAVNSSVKQQGFHPLRLDRVMEKAANRAEELWAEV
jgi:hypothetical protein